jgi:hypothetical protein
VPHQRAELADLRRGDPRLGQQIRAQQLRQDRGVGPCRSSATPRRSPCTAADAPGVRAEAVVFQQIGQPTPAESGLERHRRPHRQITDQPQERCYRPRYLNIQRLNYLSTIRHSSARIVGNLIT